MNISSAIALMQAGKAVTNIDYANSAHVLWMSDNVIMKGYLPNTLGSDGLIWHPVQADLLRNDWREVNVL